MSKNDISTASIAKNCIPEGSIEQLIVLFEQMKHTEGGRGPNPVDLDVEQEESLSRKNDCEKKKELGISTDAFQRKSVDENVRKQLVPSGRVRNLHRLYEKIISDRHRLLELNNAHLIGGIPSRERQLSERSTTNSDCYVTDDELALSVELGIDIGSDDSSEEELGDFREENVERADPCAGKKNQADRSLNVLDIIFELDTPLEQDLEGKSNGAAAAEKSGANDNRGLESSESTCVHISQTMGSEHQKSVVGDNAGGTMNGKKALLTAEIIESVTENDK